MNQEEKNYKLFTRESDGGISEREITQEELGRYLQNARCRIDREQNSSYT